MKTEVIKTRATEEERVGWERSAAGMGHSLSGWLRWVANRAIAERVENSEKKREGEKR